MKTILTAALALTVAHTAYAQPGNEDDPNCCAPAPQPPPPPQPQPAAAPQEVAVIRVEAPVAAAAAQPAPIAEPTDSGWSRPVGRRFLHGFRLGWTYLYNMNEETRMDENGMPTSIGKEFGLKSPNMMLIGYEGFYRIVGHSWLNVLMVGNVTVAGLEQSKFIPAASGLLGFEFDRSFQLGVGVNLTPDPESPSHMIAAAGWTPDVGSIQMPIHFFFVPDTEGNHRMGATVGVTW
jgi:hypothetical protein